MLCTHSFSEYHVLPTCIRHAIKDNIIIYITCEYITSTNLANLLLRAIGKRSVLLNLLPDVSAPTMEETFSEGDSLTHRPKNTPAEDSLTFEAKRLGDDLTEQTMIVESIILPILTTMKVSTV